MRRSMYRKLHSRAGGVSPFELVLIIGIVLMLAVFGVIIYQYHALQVAHGNDTLAVNTAESVAKTNSLNGISCPVNDCPGGDCPHHFLNRYVGYYDYTSHKIVARPTGTYNQSKNPEALDKTYKGEAQTMLLRVVTENGTIKIDWITPDEAT